MAEECKDCPHGNALGGCNVDVCVMAPTTTPAKPMSPVQDPFESEEDLVERRLRRPHDNDKAFPLEEFVANQKWHAVLKDLGIESVDSAPASREARPPESRAGRGLKVQHDVAPRRQRAGRRFFAREDLIAVRGKQIVLRDQAGGIIVKSGDLWGRACEDPEGLVPSQAGTFCSVHLGLDRESAKVYVLRVFSTTQ